MHLGHYIGTLKSRVEMQDAYDTFLLVADYHVLTTKIDRIPDLRRFSIDTVKDNISVGVNPSKVTYYLQSDVPEVVELSFLFGMLMPLRRLELVPTLKEKVKESGGEESASYGLLGYPVLQSADILLTKSEVVPVGKDQASHVETTREIAARFNKLFGKTFPEPKALLGKTIPGIDGAEKMGKSLGNALSLSDNSSEVRRKIMSMYTDPNRIRATDPGTVEGNPVFVYHEMFNSNKAEVEDLKDRYRAGKVGDVEVKEKLFLALDGFLIPIREKRSKIKDSDVLGILAEGARKVRLIARETVAEARAAMKIPDLS
jgi:tryptophanyl-tRNA synthetase